MSFERWVANEIKDTFSSAKRQLESQEGFGYDIANTGKYRIQCKCYKSYAPISKIEEVPRDDGIVPVLVTKGYRLEPMAVIPFSDFKEMLADCEVMEKIRHETIKDILR